MDYQGWNDDVKRWMYIMLGRLTFRLNEADTWQVIPFCKGIAQSGKSTLLNYVTKLFYEPSDISVMANNIEEKFGLSSIYQANLFIGPEIKHDFRIDQAEFQSLVSGEEIQIARKNKNAVTIQWMFLEFWQVTRLRVSRITAVPSFVVFFCSSSVGRCPMEMPDLVISCW